MNQNLSTFEIENITAAAHEVNRRWQMTVQDSEPDPHWDKLDEELKQVARASVIGIIAKDYGPEQTHEAWVSDKKARGWKQGPVKNPTNREHPCLVSWSDLPIEQQVKDQLWVESVRNFAKQLWKLPQ